jgi:hypothetical protein
MSKIPFQEAELNIIGGLSNASCQSPDAPRFNTPVTPKENYQMVLDRKKPYWIPFTTDIQFFSPRLIPDNVVCGIMIDGGEPLEAKDFSRTGFFGVEWEYIESAGSAMEKPGVRRISEINQWKELEFPNLDAMDWEGARKLSEN